MRFQSAFRSVEEPDLLILLEVDFGGFSINFETPHICKALSTVFFVTLFIC